jgi:hypothetical protein
VASSHTFQAPLGNSPGVLLLHHFPSKEQVQHREQNRSDVGIMIMGVPDAEYFLKMMTIIIICKLAYVLCPYTSSILLEDK